MGRGRAKAKQTRVARDLKYRSFDTDFTSLERELRGDSYVEPDEVLEEADEEDDEDDPYAELANRYADDESDTRRFGCWVKGRLRGSSSSRPAATRGFAAANPRSVIPAYAGISVRRSRVTAGHLDRLRPVAAAEQVRVYQ